MTWHHLLRSLVVAGAAAAVIALATGARAEGGEGIVPIDEVHRAVLPAPEAAVEAAEAPAEARPAKPAGKARVAAKGSKAAKASAPAPAEPAATAEAAPEAPVEAPVEAPAAVVAAVPQPAAAAAAEPADAAVAAEDEPSPRRSRRIRAEAKDAVRAASLRALVEHHAAGAGVPFHLADAVIRIESRYSAGARNGPNMGLTQINTATARSLGYEGGAAGLLDPETNLRYGLKYLARAYDLAKGDTCGTILRYQAGLRAQSMTRAARVYCVRVQTIIASAQ
jgi:soluble lytic murein transglycosylase-like protein